MIENKVENEFRTLYEGIVSRVEQHPEVELRGTSLDRGPFADINVNLYVAPHETIQDAPKLNEILYGLKPDGVEPVESFDSVVNNEFHFMQYGILGFKVKIGERKSLRHTISTPEALLKATDESNAIEDGVYTAGIRLWVLPDKKLVYQNCNGVWVVHNNVSCGLYMFDKDYEIGKFGEILKDGEPAIKPDKPKKWYQKLFSS